MFDSPHHIAANLVGEGVMGSLLSYCFVGFT